MESDRKLLMQELEKLVKERDSLKKRLENMEMLVDSLKEDAKQLQNVFDIVLVDGKVVGSLYIYTGCKDTLFAALGKMQKALLKKEENASEHDNLSE